jgi:2-methylcitrate dehydratase
MPIRWAPGRSGASNTFRKFTELANEVVKHAEQQRFLALVDSLPDLESGELAGLNVLVDPQALEKAPVISSGIFH